MILMQKSGLRGCPRLQRVGPDEKKNHRDQEEVDWTGKASTSTGSLNKLPKRNS